MKQKVKRLIRFLYWRYGHEGDEWQKSLIIHYFPKMIAEKKAHNIVDYTFVLSQVEDNINEELKKEDPPQIKFKPIASIRLHDYDLKSPKEIVDEKKELRK